MSSKRQTTMAKMLREQAVRERRARKLERKQERKDSKLAAAALSAESATPDASPPAESPDGHESAGNGTDEAEAEQKKTSRGE